MAFKEEQMKMKKAILLFAAAIITALSITGCTESERVSYNLSREADNFNDVRQLTVINCLKGEVLFQMTGRMSITADVSDNQLEVIVENDEENYSKHFIGLSDNVTYIVEDINAADVSKYSYELNFNPSLWLPITPTVID